MKKLFFCLLAAALLPLMPGASEPPGLDQLAGKRTAAQKLLNAGNTAEALAVYEELVTVPANSGSALAADFNQAVSCLDQLGRQKDKDSFREKTLEAHANDWNLLKEAARSYFHDNHNGFVVAGVFERGHHRGGAARYVNSYERDRVRALQLYEQAIALAARDEASGAARCDILLDYAEALTGSRAGTESWRLQYLTDTRDLPDYEEGYFSGYYSGRGAPVDEENRPVFHKVPAGFAEASSDGERWRWALAEAERINPKIRAVTRYSLASFLHSQFGVQTMAESPLFGRSGEDGDEQKAGPYNVHILGENETIAKLATGIQRFSLPDDQNFIRMYRETAEAKVSYSEEAYTQLANIYENRRQYGKAEEVWRQNISTHGPGPQEWKKKRVDQIVNSWGRFEQTPAFAAGQKAEIGFTYRNAGKARITIHEIKVRELVGSVKDYLKENPGTIDWQKINVEQIGWMCLRKGGDAFIGSKTSEFEVKLRPRPDHWNARTEIDTGLEKAGAYLVTARMESGHESHIVVWLHDTVLVKKALNDKSAYFYAGDAMTGEPLAGVNLEFFGYKQEVTDWKKVIGRRFNILTTAFAENTDASGECLVTGKQADPGYRWLITASTPQGRLAYMGFEGIWYPDYYDAQYNQTKAFVITDRPVYRPGQSVKFKAWIGHAKYDQEDVSAFAGKDARVELFDSRNEKIHSGDLKLDAYGGFDSEFGLGEDAGLGVYRIAVFCDGRNTGGGSFRVEEYRKPEFEVNIEAPEEPVALGEKITATVKARYYFGAPVVNATVRYKVMRTERDVRWYPVCEWDWFYGGGYWWFAYDYSWYPGWRDWGCRRPRFWWGHAGANPPEVVAEGESRIRPDGTLSIVIDTETAKIAQGDSDHDYRITAEVVDESRRTITGQGLVTAARQPFKVYAWVDRGHYRVGDVVHASFSAQRPDGKPVKGAKGRLVLFSVTYRKTRAGSYEPVEKPVQEWELDADGEGAAEMQIKASKEGQYRLSYTLKDARGHAVEGGYVFCITGKDFDGKQFRFNELELVPDRKEYSPGEKVNLMVNTDRPGSTVLLFERPSNGIYMRPTVHRIESGKSFMHLVDVTKKDMPNFYIEALTISGGKVYSELREITVPPEKKVLHVEVSPSKDSYRPGEEAVFEMKASTLDGRPYSGSAVVSLYDKSVEYISGGSNVGDIREFFWKWRRHHNVQTRDSIMRYYYSMVREGSLPMTDIGAFGNIDPEDEAAGAAEEFEVIGLGGARRERKGMMIADAAMSMRADGAAPGMAFAAAPAAAEAGGGEMVQPTVRKEFADTALWIAALETDAEGKALFKCRMPENLTTWKMRTWVLGHGSIVGEGAAEVVTKKNVIVRLQAPRFFVEKDEVVLSANIHNYLEADKKMKAAITLEGSCLELLDESDGTRDIHIKAGEEQRVDWRVRVAREGEAVVRMSALTDEESDAMEMKFPVYVHGMLKTESFCGVIRPDGAGSMITMVIPEARRPELSRLEVRYSPTLAGAMVDALPYLNGYPYGCTEQTLNRFLPTVITCKVLKDMGLDLKQIREKRTNLNAQEIGDDQERAGQWKRQGLDPVFDEEEVESMAKDGLRALTSMQLSDGGWGWFSGHGERSYPHTTAYVVHGLQIAQENGLALVPGVLQNGINWLSRYQAEELKKLERAGRKNILNEQSKSHADDLDAFVYMVLSDAGMDNMDMKEFLYRDRKNLSVYAKAMFGLALNKAGDFEKRDMIIRNIEQFLVEDDENQSAWLELGNDGYWWCWYGSENEAHAYYLKLLSATLKPGMGDEDPRRLEKASRLVKYLLNNRKHATYWNSTRDTALCLEAMADYIRASAEDAPDMTVELLVDGSLKKEVKITKENLFSFDNRLVMEGDALSSGEHRLEIRRAGRGPVYFNAYLTNFTLEDFITRAGLEVKVNRDVYRLDPDDSSIKAAGSRGQVIDQKVQKYRRVRLDNGAELSSGDLVEVELVIESKNDYEYLVFEDMKAAGFEPVDLRSGYNGNEMGAYVEFRDEKVCFFVKHLPRGRHSVSYRLRAEVPGMFSALPVRASAMYAPELKANSDEIKLKISD